MAALEVIIRMMRSDVLTLGPCTPRIPHCRTNRTPPSSERLFQILEQYTRPSQYPDIRELTQLLCDVTHDEKVRILKSRATLYRAPRHGHTGIITTILSSVPQHQRLDVLLMGEDTPLHSAAYWGNTDSVEVILSHLTSEQQLEILSMRRCGGLTPADCASVFGEKETERLLRDYELRAKQQTEKQRLLEKLIDQPLSSQQVRDLYLLSNQYIIPRNQKNVRQQALIFYNEHEGGGAEEVADNLFQSLIVAGCDVIKRAWSEVSQLQSMIADDLLLTSDTSSVLILCLMSHGSMGCLQGNDRTVGLSIIDKQDPTHQKYMSDDHGHPITTHHHHTSPNNRVHITDYTPDPVSLSLFSELSKYRSYHRMKLSEGEKRVALFYLNSPTPSVNIQSAPNQGGSGRMETSNEVTSNRSAVIDGIRIEEIVTLMNDEPAIINLPLTPVTDSTHSDQTLQYKMTPTRGRALLLSNKAEIRDQNGVVNGWRKGSQHDHQNVKAMLEKFGFITTGDVKNYTAQEIVEAVHRETQLVDEHTGESVYKHLSMFVLLITSHGSKGTIVGSDHKFQTLQYKMTPTRGRALLLSNKAEIRDQNGVVNGWRKGSQHDHQNVKAMLEKFGFITTGDLKNYTAQRERKWQEIRNFRIPGQKQLNQKEKLRWIRSLSRRHSPDIKALGQLALNSYLTQKSTNKHNSYLDSDNNAAHSPGYSGCNEPIQINNNTGQQAQEEDQTTCDGKGNTGEESTSRLSTQQSDRNQDAGNTPKTTTTTTPGTRHAQVYYPAQGYDDTADIKLSKLAQICSPTDDTEETPVTGIVHQPADDQCYILVKEPNYQGQASESADSDEISDMTTDPKADVSAVVTDTACTEECDVKSEELMPLSVTMKKSEDETDPYRRTIRDLVAVPHEFAPERVVTPVYTVPRYPDNHNPLLPLALQKRLDEMSPREFLTYVLNELTLEERESLMVDERQRRKTFLVNWPYENQLNGIKMAQAGFYSVDDYDRVQCVFCRGSLHRWEQDDVPMLEHARSFAFCRFVKGLNCGNREYRSHKLTKEDMKNINLYKQPDMTPNRDGSLETDSSALGISTNRAAMVEYAPDASRLKTYNRWPASSPLAAADLCAAGFYFTGFDDQVRCFYCAGGIREWSTTDDPWEEHARWFPECEYVLQKKGEVFVNDVHARTPANKKTTRSTKAQKKEMKEKEEEQTTVEAMFEECRKFGHEDAVIIAAMKRRGPNLKKISDLIEVIYALEEKGLPLEHFDSDSTPSITTDSGYLAVPEEDRGRAMDVEMDGLSLPPPGVMDNHSQGQQAPDGACKYCYKKTRAITDATYIGLPCGHVIYCERCNKDENMKLRADPTYKPRCQFNKCGAPLTGTFKIFYA